MVTQIETIAPHRLCLGLHEIRNDVRVAVLRGMPPRRLRTSAVQIIVHVEAQYPIRAGNFRMRLALDQSVQTHEAQAMLHLALL